MQDEMKSKDQLIEELRQLRAEVAASTTSNSKQALRDSQVFLPLILNNAHDAVIAVQQDQSVQMFNKGAERLFGYRAEEVLGKHLNLLIPECFHKVHHQHVHQFIDEKDAMRPMHGYREIQARRKDGVIFFAEATIFKLSGDGQMVLAVMLRDVTERKRLETCWKRYSFIVNSSHDFMDLIDRDYVYLTVNDAFLKAQAMSRENVIGKSVTDIWGEEVFNTEIKPILDRCFSGRVTKHEFNFESPTAGLQHYEASFYPYFDEDGEVEFAAVVTRDVTDRKKHESKANTLLQAVEQAGEAVMITDLNAVIEYVNPAFSEITGYQAEEVIGKTPAILKSSAQDPAFYTELWQTISAGEVWHGTLTDRRKDGTFYPGMMSVAPLRNDAGEITHYVSTQQDMTEYKRLEDQFLQAQKMEAIGTLVGGIAHDFNNMLAAIQGNIYLSKLALENQPEVREKLDTIERLSTRAADMVKQLLTFARKDRIRMAPFSLNAFMKEGFKLAKNAIPENIEHICNTCQEDLVVSGDTTQLQQVLMNLLINASHAVSGTAQPQISCSLAHYVATDAFIDAHPDLHGLHFARLTVQDNGCGITKDHLDKVFEPFFTTKGVGEGTGLGLAMVYGAMQSHEGVIEIESEVGVGTAFHVYLPLKEKGESPEPETNSVIEGQQETILLADDEADLRSTTAEVLSSLGYQVLEAGDGEQALEIFKTHQETIDLILTDIVMPKMGGVDLARSIRQLDLEVPIIFATGYDREHVLTAEDQIDNSEIIGKPFSFEELSQLIRNKLISPD
ncbi:PAS domain S-box protein [Mariprofundus sp. NF]|nr:PAS domain S-box protein [Mariprofundus sp. NF]